MIKIIGNTLGNDNPFDTELKYLSNFWRSLDLNLINCEIELDLSFIMVKKMYNMANI